jgi:hypothetical protein
MEPSENKSDLAHILHTKSDRYVQEQAESKRKLDGWMESIVMMLQAQADRLSGCQLNQIKTANVGKEIKNLLREEFDKFITWMQSAEDKDTLYLTESFITAAGKTQRQLSETALKELIPNLSLNLENDFPVIICALHSSEKSSGSNYAEFGNQLRFLAYMHIRRRIEKQKFFS